MSFAPATAGAKRDWQKTLGIIATSVSILVGLFALKDYLDKRSVPDLSGRWVIEDKTEQSAYRPYIGSSSLFSIAVSQRGDEFTAVGEKTSLDGKSLIGAQRSPISIQGKVKGDRITATFSERGPKRESSGFFEWTLQKNNASADGRFSSTAADTSGSSTMKRQ